MPLTKIPKTREALWKEWNVKADKSGVRNTVYSVNGDQYTGEWKNNKKNGKGTQIWKKTCLVYDGDWKDNKRCGFGTLSSRTNDEFRKVYAGGWKNDKRHGYGTNFYTNTEYYEGEWYGDKRSGWGRMYYDDGSVYEGEWFNDKKNGQGMLRQANENRYEGLWKNNKKHGEGKFFFLDKGQFYKGVWVNNIAKCGTMEDCGREDAQQPTLYPIPKCKLLDKDAVVKNAEDYFLAQCDNQ